MASREKSVQGETCKRIPLTEATKLRLWNESGGYCANPQCAAALFDEAADVDFGEMADIIPASRPEVDALVTVPDRSNWTGRRDHALLDVAAQTPRRACGSGST